MKSESASRKKTVVIVGASNKPDRASYQLLQRMIRRGGYDPILVHPVLKEIDGMPVLASLSEVPMNPDIVSLYVNAKASQAMEGELERLHPGKVIFNPGAENYELLENLGRHEIDGEEACSLVLLSQNLL